MLTFRKNQKKSMKIYRIVFYFYILFQGVVYIFKSGASYDIAGFRYASGVVLNKVLLLFSNFNSPEFKIYDYIEHYGIVLPIFAYIFAHTIDLTIGEILLKTNLFINSDDVVYSFIHLFLIFYFIFLLEVIYRLLIRNYDKIISFAFLVLFYFLPSISGQYFWNIKDIPFAMHVFIAFLCYFDYSKNKYIKSEYFQVLISFLLVVHTRINGILILMMIIFVCNLINNKHFYKDVSFYLLKIKLLIQIVLLNILISPSSWRHPILWLNETVNFYVSIPWEGFTLTNGVFIYSGNGQVSYLITWFFYRLPSIYLLLILISIAGLLKNYKKINKLEKSSFYFLLIFGFSFVVVSPLAYDSERHYLFIYPFLISITLNIVKNALERKFLNLISIFLFFGILIFNYAGLENHRYIYLNEFADEEKISYYCKTNIDGCGEWFTDYQGISGKKLADKINRELINKTIFVCRPEHVFSLYLDKEKNEVILIPSFKDYEKDSFYVTTLHRPRKNLDSCNNEIKDFTCQEVITSTVSLRNTAVNLNYLSLCSKS
jgi:hypothetical protein